MKKNLQKLFLAIALMLGFSSTEVIAQATLVSQFDFNNNLNDKLSVSTASLYNNSATGYVNGALTWTANTTSNGGGLIISVPDASFTETDYSISMDVSFSIVTSYRKLIDFFDMNNDDGFYFYNSNLSLYNGGNNSGTTTLNPNTYYTILMTRTGADDTARAYVVQNNALLFECKVKDVLSQYTATLIGTDRKLGFFHDDCCGEYPDSGAVRSIRIWNGIVNINNVCNSSANYTVTPSSLSVCSGGSKSFTFGASPDPAFTTYTFNPLGTTTPTAIISPTANTTYSLYGDYYSTSCFTPSTGISVTVSPNPTVTAVSGSSIICGPPFQGTATLTASGANSFTWSTASTNTSIAVSPSLTTTYTVTGTSSGCTGSVVITQSVSTCTDIQSLNGNYQTLLSIYPNPSNGEFTVNVNVLSENMLMEIYNVIGKLVYSKQLTSSSSNVNLNNHANGIYMIRILDNKNQVSVSKIIKD